MNAKSLHSTVAVNVRPVSWLAIASLTVGAFALVTTELMPIGLLPEISHGTHVTDGQAGMMVTMTGLIAAGAAPLSVVLAGRVDRRKLLLALLALLVASNLVVATATGLSQLLLGRILLGATVGGFWTIAGSLGPRLRPGPEGIRASALILAGVSIGTVAGVPAGSLIGHLLGWRTAFATGAAIGGLAIVTLLTLLPSIPPERGINLREIPSLLDNSRARTALIAATLVFIGQFTAYTYIAPFVDMRAGIHGQALSGLLLISGGAGFFGNIAGGWLSSRNATTSAATMAFVLSISMLALEIFGSSAIAAWTLATVWGLAFGMLPIAMQTWLQEFAAGHVEVMQALFVSMAQVAIGGGALVGGLIVDHSNMNAAFLSGGGAALVTAVMILAVSTKHTTVDDYDACSATT